MPIKGISEVRRLPRLGKIRLGIKAVSQKGSEYPKAVDYFVCNSDKSTPEAAAAAFHAVYGDKPKAIDVMFPVEDRDQFFPQFYRRYGSGTGLLCKGDGERATEVNRETGEMTEIECLGEDCPWAKKNPAHCRPVGTIQFLLYKVPGLGVWNIDTTSFHSIVNLNSAIDFIRQLTGGRISWLPLKLVLRPKEVQAEGKKKTVFIMDLAHEEVRLEDVLKASKTSISGLLLPSTSVELPAVNYEEAPDDLYAQSVISGAPKDATDAAAVTSTEEEDTDPVVDPEVMDEEEDPFREVTLKAIHEIWDELKTPEAKRKAILSNPQLDLAKLLVQLQAEQGKRQEANKGKGGSTSRKNHQQAVQLPEKQGEAVAKATGTDGPMKAFF
jgi:hypothetical protein